LKLSFIESSGGIYIPTSSSRSSGTTASVSSRADCETLLGSEVREDGLLEHDEHADDDPCPTR
jgi:hypothetical protein